MSKNKDEFSQTDTYKIHIKEKCVTVQTIDNRMLIVKDSAECSVFSVMRKAIDQGYIEVEPSSDEVESQFVMTSNIVTFYKGIDKKVSEFTDINKCEELLPKINCFSRSVSLQFLSSDLITSYFYLGPSNQSMTSDEMIRLINEEQALRKHVVIKYQSSRYCIDIVNRLKALYPEVDYLPGDRY